jgi:twitching motility protein PilT
VTRGKECSVTFTGESKKPGDHFTVYLECKTGKVLRLVPRADGHGRVPAVEVMIATPFIRDCIINKDKTKLIHEAIAAGVSQYGMQTFDQSIFQLYKKELITYDEALRRASNPDEFKLKIQGIQSTSDMAAEEMEKTMQSFDVET